MWPFKKKRYSIIGSGLLEGMTDCHCHILPGVDDGVQDQDEALRTLSQLTDLGMSDIWLTPHIMEDIPNEPTKLRQKFMELQKETDGNGVSLHLAAEHMIDNLFRNRLAKDDLLPFCFEDSENTLLLVETSYYNPPMHLYDTIEDIRDKGYIPLLAHPERYVYMHTPDYYHLKELGVKFQLNMLSLVGAYGGDAVRKSHKLLTNGFYSACGTDLHHLEDFMDYASDECLSSQIIDMLKELLVQFPEKVV